jgi:hypothetical protein
MSQLTEPGVFPHVGVNDNTGASDGADASGRKSMSDPDRLSAIPEEYSDDSDDVLVALEGQMQELTVLGLATSAECDDPIAEGRPYQNWGERVHVCPGFHYLATHSCLDELDRPNEQDIHGNYFVDMLFPGDAAKLILDQPPPPQSCARLRVFLAGHSKKAVIETDTDLLTPEEYRKHAREVAAAMHEELRIWIQHQCFTRRPRKGARNILDVRWVGKWKKVKSSADPNKLNRIIRMRMTLRGFKDTG